MNVADQPFGIVHSLSPHGQIQIRLLYDFKKKPMLYPQSDKWFHADWRPATASEIAQLKVKGVIS